MGWANCGTDSKGRPIGYAFSATCDHPGCKTKIHRGLAYACGGMHGNDTLPAIDDVYVCDGYFCADHLFHVSIKDELIQMCPECAKQYPDAVSFADEADELA